MLSSESVGAAVLAHTHTNEILISKSYCFEIYQFYSNGISYLMDNECLKSVELMLIKDDFIVLKIK